MEQYKDIAPRLVGLREGIGWTVKEMADLLSLPEERLRSMSPGPSNSGRLYAGCIPAVQG